MKQSKNAIKKENTNKILRTLVKHKRLTRQELIDYTSLSKTTVYDIVDELINQDVLKQEKVTGDQKLGRKKSIVSLNADYGSYIGVAISSKHIKIIVSNLCFDKIQSHDFDIVDVNVDGIMDFVFDKLAHILESIHNPLGVTLSVPGIVNSEKGIILYSPELNMKDYNINDHITKKIKCNVYVENDLNLIAFAEQNFGNGIDRTNFVNIKMDKGVGASLVLNNKLYKGSNFLSGEVGYFVTGEIGDFKADFGNFGYFEKHLLSNRDDIIVHLSIVLANITSLLNPQVIILHNDTSENMDIDIEELKEQISRCTPIPVEIEFSNIMEEAEVLGCVYNVYLRKLLGEKVTWI